jgi:hypothetical protein
MATLDSPFKTDAPVNTVAHCERITHEEYPAFFQGMLYFEQYL